MNEWIEVRQRQTETWRRNSGTPVVRGCFVWFEPGRAQRGEPPWLAAYLDYSNGGNRPAAGSNTVTRGFDTLAEGQAWIEGVVAAVAQ
ncbi:MAG: hypothetical protein WKF57_19030 [Nakamurella sp.]